MLKFYILLVANFLFYLDMKLLLGLSYQTMHVKEKLLLRINVFGIPRRITIIILKKMVIN